MMSGYELEMLAAIRSKMRLILQTQRSAGDELIELAATIPEDIDAKGAVAMIGEDLDAAVALLQSELEELDDFIQEHRPDEVEAA